MSKIIHIVRHGEVHNPTGVLYGRLPGFHLSAQGKEQAQAVAQWAKDKNICYIAISPMERAQETALPLIDSINISEVSVITDENLLEGASAFEGKKVAFGDGALSRPWHWWKLRNPFRPSWGEPYEDIAQRMNRAIEKALVAIDDGQEAMLITHQLPAWIARLKLTGKKLWHNPTKRQCALASVTSYTYDQGTLTSITYHEPAGSSDPRITGA